jgi:sugar phosphate isomerase/epimerase
MRFGTTTIPLAGWLADPRQPDSSRTQRLAVVRKLIEGYGLSAVELTADLCIVYPQVFDASYYAAVADLQQELGFACTVHLPFMWVDLASLNEPVRQASLSSVRRAMTLTKVLEVETYVLHLWGLTATQIETALENPGQREAILSALIAQAERSLAGVCELLDPPDLCVENLEDALFARMLPRLERFGTSICLDVGHLAWQGGGEVEFLAQHGDRVREVHLHDAIVSPVGGHPPVRDHLPLSQGRIDYLSFLCKLVEIGFDGAVILENTSQADLEKSLEAVQAFL